VSSATARMDMTTLSVVHNHLVNICREMGTAMMRTSYSPIFNEGLDFSCVLFNRDGEMIAQAEFCPAQLGAILYTVKWTIAELGLESFEEGDVVIHNDPYRGGCHMPEHMVLKPIFYDGELFGFAAKGCGYPLSRSCAGESTSKTCGSWCWPTTAPRAARGETSTP